MALYKGRPADALLILEPAARADIAAKDSSRAAAKYMLQAEALLMKGQTAKAIAAAEHAANGSTDESLLYPAAMVFLEAGKSDKAMELSQKLSQRLEPDPGAYGKLIEAEVQMKKKPARPDARSASLQANDSRREGSVSQAWAGSDMKKIECVIRPIKIDEVKEA